jgi:MoaA/NifB/PqqE/SkfB family radical SAM enzyme
MGTADQLQELCLATLEVINADAAMQKDHGNEDALQVINMQLAQIALDKSHEDDALAYLSAVFSLFPEDAYAHAKCGEIYARRGDLEKARYHLCSAIQTLKTAPRDCLDSQTLFRCYKTLSELQIKLRRIEEAVESYRNMLTILYYPDADAKGLDIDTMYEMIDAAIRMSSDTSPIYLNPDLKEIHLHNPHACLNELYAMVELLQNSNMVKTKPTGMFISLTGRCNLHCIMCGADEFRTWDITPSVVDEIKSLYPYLKFIQWRGGEAFLSSYFEDLVESALRYPHLEQSINTNGLLIDEKWADRLVRGSFNIIFSIDGVHPEIYESVRRGGSFEKLIKSLNLVKKAREKISSRTFVSMTFVVMKENYNDLPVLVDFAKEYGIDELRVSKLVPFGSNSFIENDVTTDPTILGVVRRSLYQIAVDARREKIAFCDWFSDTTDKIDSQENPDTVCRCASVAVADTNSVRTKICTAPWKYLFINTGGDIFPHCFCATKLGNISEVSLMNVWTGHAIRSLRDTNAQCAPNNLSRCHELIL